MKNIGFCCHHPQLGFTGSQGSVMSVVNSFNRAMVWQQQVVVLVVVNFGSLVHGLILFVHWPPLTAASIMQWFGNSRYSTIPAIPATR